MVCARQSKCCKIYIYARYSVYLLVDYAICSAYNYFCNIKKGIMKNILYFEPSDVTKFDFERFKKSLNSYAKVSDKDINGCLKMFDGFENLHVSRLVEAGAALIEKNSDVATAKKYFEDHEQYFGSKFERLRRITGYLVGTLERWNDGKKAEERERVKHSVNSSINDSERAARLEAQALAHNVAYASSIVS